MKTVDQHMPPTQEVKKETHGIEICKALTHGTKNCINIWQQEIEPITIPNIQHHYMAKHMARYWHILMYSMFFAWFFFTQWRRQTHRHSGIRTSRLYDQLGPEGPSWWKWKGLCFWESDHCLFSLLQKETDCETIFFVKTLRSLFCSTNDPLLIHFLCPFVKMIDIYTQKVICFVFVERKKKLSCQTWPVLTGVYLNHNSGMVFLEPDSLLLTSYLECWPRCGQKKKHYICVT